MQCAAEGEDFWIIMRATQPDSAHPLPHRGSISATRLPTELTCMAMALSSRPGSRRNARRGCLRNMRGVRDHVHDRPRSGVRSTGGRLTSRISLGRSKHLAPGTAAARRHIITSLMLLIGNTECRTCRCRIGHRSPFSRSPDQRRSGAGTLFPMGSPTTSLPNCHACGGSSRIARDSSFVYNGGRPST